jgi:hypothetical protein
MKKLMDLTCLFVTAFLLLSLPACKKKCHDPQNPECEDYDPCYGVIKPSADFKTRHWSHWGTDPFPGETIEFCDTIMNNTAKFIANYTSGYSYTWKVGTDNRVFSGKELVIDFIDFYIDTTNLEKPGSDFYKPIPVTLTVKTKPNGKNKIGSCTPFSDTQLSVTRNLVIFRGMDRRFCGIFKGRIAGEQQDRIVQIFYKVDKNRPFGSLSYLGFVNLPNVINFDTLRISELGDLSTYKNQRWNHGKCYQVGIDGFDDINGIYAGSIFCELQQDGKKYIRFEYTSITKDLKTEKSYIFTGKEM